MGTTLQFCSLQSKVDVAFWGALGDLKLHRLKLEEGPEPLRAFWAPSNHAELPGFLTVSSASLAPGEAPAAVAALPGAAGAREDFTAFGDLYVLNTKERMLSFDRKAAVNQACARMWESIQSGAAERDPSLLLRTVLLAYCDLKHYKYRYWFAVPALQPPQPFTLAAAPSSLQQALGESARAVATACNDHAAASGHQAWLLALGTGGEVEAVPLTDWYRLQQEGASSTAGTIEAGGNSGQGGSASSSGGEPQLFLAIADCSNLPEHPGWPLRNLLLLAAVRWGAPAHPLRVLCMRERHGRFDPSASLALTINLPQLPADFTPAPVGGWEPNERGKLRPRVADLGPSMDPRHLAESAVDLNLRLMRWRAAPALDVGAIAATRCLLLGAGTLGCSVARTLLGWGVRHVTFVDNSRVAYSNPVRQSLYTFEDCQRGGRPKAQAAADALHHIFPGVAARGVQLSIPMPGHPLAEAELTQVQRDIEALEQLVDEHDVVFLLMDTRESRWLPTLLCAARGRLAINAALGFDGFMVMRHGAPLPPKEPSGVQAAAEGHAASDVKAAANPGEVAAVAAAARSTNEQAGETAEQAVMAAGSGETAGSSPAPPLARLEISRLGCYFCNDVVAPLNSTVDRTLDQQCTVARPGLSAIAGSLAVELMAAVLQHPAGAAAPAAGSPAAAASHQSTEGGQAPPLGDPPHMIRGQLGGFSQMCLTGQAFRQCTACSEVVVREYRRRGADFVTQGLLHPKSLEDLTGLTELHRASEAALEAWASSGEEEEEEPQEQIEGRGGDKAAAGAAGRSGCSAGQQGSLAMVGRVDAPHDEDWEEL